MKTRTRTVLCFPGPHVLYGCRGDGPVNRTEESLTNLRKAHAAGNLVIYVGAGVSVGSGLPTWQKLVLAMYFSALSKQSVKQWHL